MVVSEDKWVAKSLPGTVPLMLGPSDIEAEDWLQFFLLGRGNINMQEKSKQYDFICINLLLIQ